MSDSKHLFWWTVSLLGSPLCYVPFLFMPHFLWLVAFVEVVSWSIKLCYKKDRPKPYLRTNMYTHVDANSFPSIHSARISAVASYAYYSFFSPHTLMIAVLAALLVGYSRVYLKKHFWEDVLVGFLLGTTATILLFSIV